MRRARLAALVTLLGTALAARAPSAQLGLRPSFGGAVLEGRVVAGAADELTGVWSGSGHARLLKCTPRCAVVPAVPVAGILRMGTATPYRVAVSGEFRAGQRVRLALRFRSLQVLNVEATVLGR